MTMTDIPLKSTTTTAAYGPEIQTVPITQLRTSYVHLRPGKPSRTSDNLRDLPLRVVVTANGHLEVVDGFKRLARWSEAGATHMPVVVELGGQGFENKRLLLQANAPRKTITPMDEALVVHSLVEDDKLTLKAAAKLLGKKVGWASCRLALSKHSSAKTAEAVSKGTVGVSLAQELTALSDEEQDNLLEAMGKHGLRSREAILLVHTYRVASTSDRKQLLKDPIPLLRPKPTEIISPRATDLEERLKIMGKTIEELRSFSIPSDLAPPETRRLSALYRSVCQELVQTVRALGFEDTKEENDEDEYPRTKESLEGHALSGGRSAVQVTSKASAAEPKSGCIGESMLPRQCPTVDKDRQQCGPLAIVNQCTPSQRTGAPRAGAG